MKLSSLYGPMLILCNSQQGYDRNQSSPEAIRRRSMRNKARREMEKAGKVHRGDGKHVHHKRALSNGGSNSKRNLAVTDAHSNHSEGRKVSASHQKKKKK